uniref:AAA+ ATPase domain-containing protein n=1 Tax=Oryza glumipatula TaxID=40148 RepID=A0A0D9YQK2_9ORYZ
MARQTNGGGSNKKPSTAAGGDASPDKQNAPPPDDKKPPPDGTAPSPTTPSTGNNNPSSNKEQRPKPASDTPAKSTSRGPARGGGRRAKKDPPPPPQPPLQPAAAAKGTLDAFGRDLTLEAANADPVEGSEEEIDRVVCILSCKSKNSAVFVGAAGVGKTAIAEGLAQRIARGEVSGVLAGARVVELNVAAMISGTSYRGTFEKRMTGVIADAEADAAAGKVVLFVDEIHMLLGAGRVSGGCIDASNMLKPALARGRVRCLGATTHDEYHRYMVRDAAFERRFQKVHVAEPSVDDTVAILRRLKPSYQDHHVMEIQDAALVAAPKLSGRYIPARHFPDKAIDLVDEACATARLLMDRRKKKQAQAAGSSNGGDTPVAVALAPKDENVGPDHIARVRRTPARATASTSRAGETLTAVDTHAYVQIVSKWTGIPVASLGEDERKKLLELPQLLHRRVIGQDEAVGAVAEAVVRSRSGLGNPNQPSGSFLFLGPTGVGKTELAKALAEQLFGNAKLLVRIDMSEYVNASTVTRLSRLIGSTPGTNGYDKGGQLTELVRWRPYSVVLFDEVEKADAAVFNVFLQILDDGRLTDGQGRTVDFTNTIIIMTSNLGAQHLSAGASHEDDATEAAAAAAKQRVLADVQRHFRPELISRLTEMVVFRPLSGEQLRKVARLQLHGMAARLAEKGIGLDVADAALDVVLARSSDQLRAYGARPIKRCLEKDVMTRISKMVVQEEVDDDCYADAEENDAAAELSSSSSAAGKKRKRRPPARYLVVIDDDEYMCIHRMLSSDPTFTAS